MSPAWVAEERNRIFGKELPESEKRVHADPAHKAKVTELEAWGQFKVSSPLKMGTQPKDLVGARWVSTLQEVDASETVEARA